jgi:hypothetical protein
MMDRVPEGYRLEHWPTTRQYRFVAPDGFAGIWHFSRDLVCYMASRHALEN